MLKRKITEQELYDKIDSYSLFNYYFGRFDFGKKYHSVFRTDDTPSTGFFRGKSGRIVYRDIATGEVWEPVTFVMKLHSLSYHEAIDRIAKDFGLLKGYSPTKKAKIFKKEEVEKVVPKKVFSIHATEFKEHHLNYWKQFHITKDELFENNVFAVMHFYKDLVSDGKIIERREFLGLENELQFAYVINYKGKESIKLYAPYDKKYKWMGDVPGTHLFGFDELPYKSDTLIITKGQKDRIIFKKFFTDVLAVQSESKTAISEEDITMLSKAYKNIYVNFDCDKVGKEASSYFNKFGWKWVNVPNIYYEENQIKDFADLVKEKGLNIMHRYLKWKEIL
ncbi:hypothetical protein [Leptolyngbya phage Lbo-JY46]